jgi:hypothetical protein
VGSPCNKVSIENFKSSEMFLCLPHEKGWITFSFSGVLCVGSETLSLFWTSGAKD